MSFKEEKNNVSKWSRYSSSQAVKNTNDVNLRELLKKAYDEKNLTNFLNNGSKLIIVAFCYYSWNIWRWFSPTFYKKLCIAFVQEQTDQEETDLKGWLSYVLRNTPRKIQQYNKDLYTKILDGWTLETTLRVILLPTSLILGCLQASYARYSFLLPNYPTTYQSISWKDFKSKEVFLRNVRKLEKKNFKLYDKFILLEAPENNKNYRVLLPPTTSNKDILVTIRKMIQTSVKGKVSASNEKKISQSETATKIFSKNKDLYKKNSFRHLRTRTSSLKTQSSSIFFYNDPRDFFPGYISNASCLVRIYAAIFPVWLIIAVLEKIEFIKADVRMTKAKKVRKSQNKKRFTDLAGIEKILPDLQELVQSLILTVKRTKLNMYAPKGYILVGPPGTGKTLLAQAIAGESKVTFFFTAGSEFLENQNGIGPARLRDLFRKAKRESPAIIFIDEIDTLGKTREGSVNSLGNLTNLNQGEEKIQILTEFLVQMDGFSERNNVVIIGATNFLHLLDPAFIRPGRFDRIFQLELPSKTVRIEILQLHAAKKGSDPSIPWDFFGKMTNGFSGADLSAIVNESLLKLIREKKQLHTFESLQHGFNRISTYSREETTSKSRDIFTKTRRAYYQAGIGLIHTLKPELANKLSLELKSRPKNLRYLKLEKQVKANSYDVVNRKMLEARIMSHLAGVATEFYILKELSILQNQNENFWLSQQGSTDLEKAAQLIRIMVDEYGMYDESFFVSGSNGYEKNSTHKRFNEFEIHSYDQIWDSLYTQFLHLLNEEEDKEKPIRVNWRFLSFWTWHLISDVYSSKPVPKWGKSYIDEKQQENQDKLLPDDYFHKNQLLKENSSYKTKRDVFIQNILRTFWEEMITYIESNRELLDFLAHSLLIQEKLIEEEVVSIVSKYQKIPEKVI